MAMTRCFGFNPRARTGRDMCALQRIVQGLVSIHAPARGATLDVAMVELDEKGFNPRARTGRDLSRFLR